LGCDGFGGTNSRALGSIPAVTKLVWVHTDPRRITWCFALNVSTALPRFIRNPDAILMP